MEPLPITGAIVLLLFIGAALVRRRNMADGSNIAVESTSLSQPAPITPVEAAERSPSDGPAKPARKRKPPRVVEITVDTPLGPVTFKKPRRRVSALVVALGQSDEHLNWFFDIYRREYLERAVANLKACHKGTKDRSLWTPDYFEFMQEAPMLLANLSDERQQAIRENHEKIDGRQADVLGTYETTAQAREAARWLAKKKEATRNAGWLNVHVVELPEQNA